MNTPGCSRAGEIHLGSLQGGFHLFQANNLNGNQAVLEGSKSRGIESREFLRKQKSDAQKNTLDAPDANFCSEKAVSTVQIGIFALKKCPRL